MSRLSHLDPKILIGLAAFWWALSLGLWCWGSLEESPRTRNIYDQQRSNRRLSWLLMGGLCSFVALIGFGVDVFELKMRVPWLGLNMPDLEAIPFAEGTRGYWDAVAESRKPGIPYATLMATAASLIMAHYSFIYAPALVVAATGARRADSERPEQAQLLNVVSEMATAAGLPMPKVFVVPDSDLNAFATGTSPEDAYVAVTHGLLLNLDREELQGVIAHEMSHIRNGDMEVMTLAVALSGAAALLSDWTTRKWRYSRGHDSSSAEIGAVEGDEGKSGGSSARAIKFLWIAVVLLAPVITAMIKMAISRKREYLADASGAELTRNPVALIRALEKIHAAVEPTTAIGSQSFAHLCIDDPQGSKLNDRSGLIADLFSTHPPMKARLQALREMAYLPSQA